MASVWPRREQTRALPLQTRRGTRAAESSDEHRLAEKASPGLLSLADVGYRFDAEIGLGDRINTSFADGVVMTLCAGVRLQRIQFGSLGARSNDIS